MELYNFQKEILEETRGKNRVAYYYDMGLGKTYIGSEKIKELMEVEPRFLLVCQKAKVKDWIKHFQDNYSFNIFDLTKNIETIIKFLSSTNSIGIINYDLIFRRPLLKTQKLNLCLDESSLIQNTQAQRTKFILNLNYNDVILLSGTPTSGKYENLYSQLKLLGYDKPKMYFYQCFVDYIISDHIGGMRLPRAILQIKGYKNIDKLKELLKHYNCYFKRSDEVLTLPKQNFITIDCKPRREYKEFTQKKIIEIQDNEGKNIVLEGDHIFRKMMALRYLCGYLSREKLERLKTLLESTEDRVIVFYQFENDLKEIKDICKSLNKPISFVNGKDRTLLNYENESNSVTIVQYQAGSMGLNLQKANKIIYFTPTLSSDLFEQSKKRIHRIGQEQPCFYYILKSGIEYHIYKTLEMRENYTRKLFIEDYGI